MTAHRPCIRSRRLDYVMNPPVPRVALRGLPLLILGIAAFYRFEHLETIDVPTVVLHGSDHPLHVKKEAA